MPDTVSIIKILILLIPDILTPRKSEITSSLKPRLIRKGFAIIQFNIHTLALCNADIRFWSRGQTHSSRNSCPGLEDIVPILRIQFCRQVQFVLPPKFQCKIGLFRDLPSDIGIGISVDRDSWTAVTTINGAKTVTATGHIQINLRQIKEPGVAYLVITDHTIRRTKLQGGDLIFQRSEEWLV